MAIANVLLVDDDEVVLSSLAKILEHHNFKVTTASTVAQALKHISSGEFEVLLSDLHMPGAGDGLTVVSAMRHANPNAITMLLSAFPEMNAAAQAIMLQADEILVKPMQVSALIDAIKKRLTAGPARLRVVESVADILERCETSTVEDWYDRIQQDKGVMAISLTRDVRCNHLRPLLRDVVSRLRSFKPMGTKDSMSNGATDHGTRRSRQGYTPAQMVEESRVLQVSIFNSLQKNLASIDFSVLLIGVMTIADEVDSQLSQAMQSYAVEERVAVGPA